MASPTDACLEGGAMLSQTTAAGVAAPLVSDFFGR